MFSKRQGFTLLELLITLVIVVVLVAMGVPAMTELFDRMRTEDAVSRWQADLNVCATGRSDLQHDRDGVSYCYR